MEALLTAHSDLKSFMLTFNPDLQLACARNEERAYFGTAPTLVVMNQAYHETAAEQWLIPQLVDLCAYCGVKEKLNERQLKQLACTIVTGYGELKATEVMLFFHKFKTGNYGQFYGSVDPLIIMQAMKRFMKERDRMIEQKESEEYWRKQEEWKREKRYSPQEFCKKNGLPVMSSMLEVMRYRDMVIGFVEAICKFIKNLYEAQNRLQKKT